MRSSHGSGGGRWRGSCSSEPPVLRPEAGACSSHSAARWPRRSAGCAGIPPLAPAFANAVFVHMGGSMTKEQELGTIKSVGIHYKHAEIQETSVRLIGDTAILLSRLRLDAV